MKSRRTTASTLAQQAEERACEGDFVQALSLAERALKEDDTNALAWKTLTRIQFSLGDDKAAVASMRRYLDLSPDDAPAWSVLGSTLKDLQRYDEAEEAHQRAVQIAPNEGTCWYNLGVLYEVTNLPGARDAYLRAIECDKSDAAAWYNLGNVRHLLNDHAGAVEAVQHSLAIDPNDADAWDNLGSFLGFVEQWEAAEDAVRRAIAINPAHPNARARLTLILRKLGRDDFEPAQQSSATTSNCSQYNHPEFIMHYETPPVTPDAVHWLVDYLESSVASGERFKAGETVQIGWMITQLHEENGMLCLSEPDFRSVPVQWIPSVNQTLIDLFMQQLTAQAAGFEEEIDLPNWYQSAIACKRFGEDLHNFYIQRAPGARDNPQDSGWFCGCLFVDCDHESMDNLRLASLYELASMNRQIVQYLGLPESCDAVVTADGVAIGRYGKPVKMLQRNQTC